MVCLGKALYHFMARDRSEGVTPEQAGDVIMHYAFQVELNRIRFLSESQYLKFYSDRNEKWELLCLICSLGGDPRYGVYDYLGMLKTIRCSNLTLLKFLRERIKCGDFIVVPGEKKSRKTLRPCDGLMNEFRVYQERWVGWVNEASA